jgi:hypothetical protein
MKNSKIHIFLIVLKKIYAIKKKLDTELKKYI